MAYQVVQLVKNLPASARDTGDAGSNPGSGKIPWRRKWQPLLYSCWEILWTEEPNGLQSIGSQRVKHG